MSNLEVTILGLLARQGPQAIESLVQSVIVAEPSASAVKAKIAALNLVSKGEAELDDSWLLRRVVAAIPSPSVERAQAPRAQRRSGAIDAVSASDCRTAFQRDRDRLLYSDYLRRLASVTQVASAAEGASFHNRLTHSIKVAQVGRRLAELLLSRDKDLAGFLDPDVVEAAALAHDLGHPPFGHVADRHLCALAVENDLGDGFEGNAQTFRIVTRLSVRRSGGGLGLDLTRATLAATAKYPWFRKRTVTETRSIRSTTMMKRQQRSY